MRYSDISKLGQKALTNGLLALQKTGY